MKEILKSIIKDFQKTLPKKDVIPRELEIPRNSKKIISLIGPRRCGKTYYAYQLINSLCQTVAKEKIIYINFEDERLDLTASQLQLIIDAYFELYPDYDDTNIYIFFDEIQTIDGWEKFIRRIYDTVTRNIFITGSSAKMLGKEIATSLRGRNIVFNLYPLSFKEFCRFQKIDTNDLYSARSKAILISQFDRYMRMGSYPETVFMDAELCSRTLQEYYNVMLFRDIVERHNVANVVILKQFINKTMNNISSIFSVNKFYNELKSQGFSVSKNTIYEFLDYSLDCFLFFILNQYESSYMKQQMGNKKVYAIDTGLVNAVTYRFSRDQGKLLENIVYLQLIRQEKPVYFLRNNQECDFVVQEEIVPQTAIQASYILNDELTRKREIKGLIKTLEKLNLKEGYIITLDEEEDFVQDNKKIIVKPVWKWLLTDDKL